MRSSSRGNTCGALGCCLAGVAATAVVAVTLLSSVPGGEAFLCPVAVQQRQPGVSSSGGVLTAGSAQKQQRRLAATRYERAVGCTGFRAPVDVHAAQQHSSTAVSSAWSINSSSRSSSHTFGLGWLVLLLLYIHTLGHMYVCILQHLHESTYISYLVPVRSITHPPILHTHHVCKCEVLLCWLYSSSRKTTGIPGGVTEYRSNMECCT